MIAITSARRRAIPLLTIVALASVFSKIALAQTDICGAPPPVANEHLKGDIEGRAEFLSRFVGDASLVGKIETSREEIFSKYPDEDERSDAYFEYMICVVIMNDTDMSTTDKIQELKTVRRQFYQTKPPDSPGSITVKDSTGVIIGNQNNMSLNK